MAELLLKNIKKIYSGNVIAVENVNLKIEDKEFIVFVGPSGCGKSTTLRMIAGLEDISEGELFIDDELMNNVPPKDRNIAMVFQNYALYPHMTVYDNMAFGLKLRKLPKIEIDQKVNEAATILGITEYLNRKPRALSGGQRQRVALGRALVRNPKVFLLDEPLSNLDAKLRVQTRTEISKLHKKLQTTFVYVTHDQTEAMTMADRIVIMKDGFIQQVSTPKEVYENPENIFVAGFIGSPQMNFINAKIIGTSELNCKISFGNVEFKIPKGKAKVLTDKNYLGKEVVLGIRPEHLHEEPIFLESSKDSIMKVKVEVVEMMGSESYLYIDMFGKVGIAKVDSRFSPKMGDFVELAIDKNRIKLFDKETEEAII